MSIFVQSTVVLLNVIAVVALLTHQPTLTVSYVCASDIFIKYLKTL